MKIVWESKDDGLRDYVDREGRLHDVDDDNDGRLDKMLYEYKDGTLEIYHAEYVYDGRERKWTKIHQCLVYQGDPFPTPHQVPGPPRHPWDYSY